MPNNVIICIYKKYCHTADTDITMFLLFLLFLNWLITVKMFNLSVESNVKHPANVIAIYYIIIL